MGEIDEAEAAFSQDFLDAEATDAQWYRCGMDINGEVFWLPGWSAPVRSESFMAHVVHHQRTPSPPSRHTASSPTTDRGLRSRAIVADRLLKVMEEAAV